ncbi:MAG: hypoxanthine phosphoribosyltransferase [Bacteroidales bacterium]|nr:hypoxanthine phosphoribosyltransferase [Bacteroidales bacterium]
MRKIKLLDKEFQVSIYANEIQQAVNIMAEKMNQELKGKEVIFLGILNGAFMFASDLIRKINFPTQISFLKLASYSGTSSSGEVKQLIGVNENIAGKTVVVLEDIVDSGITIEQIIEQLQTFEPSEIKIAALLFKPDAFKKKIRLDYVGIEIPNNFIVGYGLDYNGFGRNLKDIYTVI